MAEQSSTVVAFRALIMLICLILIPVAAFCGSSFPAVVSAIQSGRWPTLADFRGPSGPPSGAAKEAPRFVPTPTTGTPQASDPKTMGFSGSGPVQQGESLRSPVIAASYLAPISTPPSSEARLSTSFPQSKELSPGANPGLSPLPAGMGNLVPVDHPAAPAHSDAPASWPGATAASSSPSDQFKFVQDRLRQLGATYYLLETCGDQKREFRFYCRMSIGGNPRVTKPFWCFDGDPLKAMTQVLKQVEDWQSAGG
jgi:hypothetical protein